MVVNQTHHSSSWITPKIIDWLDYIKNESGVHVDQSLHSACISSDPSFDIGTRGCDFNAAFVNDFLQQTPSLQCRELAQLTSFEAHLLNRLTSVSRSCPKLVAPCEIATAA